MNTDRAIAGILTTSIAAVLLLGLWLLWDASRAPTPTPVATPAPVATAAPATAAPQRAATAAARAVGHRLAGTVVGDVRYAIIVDAQGANGLYRPGQQVPGLGELVDVAESSVTINGDDGEFQLRLASAPTDTPTLAKESPTEAPLTPAPWQPRDRSGSESSP